MFKFLDFIHDDEETHSLYLYRQGLILKVLLFIAEFQVRTNTRDIAIIQALQNKIIKLGKEYKNYPAVTTEEEKCLDSTRLQKLLEIKEISTLISSQSNDNLIEAIWGNEVKQNININKNSLEGTKLFLESELMVTDTTERIVDVISDSHHKNNQEIEDKSLSTSSNNSRQSSFVRVDVEGLERLNYLAGELLIYQKRRNLQDEQLKEVIEQLFQQIQRHQATLNELRDLPIQRQNFDMQQRQNFASVDFDSLEMDKYTDFHLKLHEATEEILQLQETTESLDLILKQASQVHEKQQRLSLGIMDNLVEARMSPLGNIMHRFSQMVQNLGNVYGKNVELKLTGTEVLVDKVIVEKLYDPLLQLVRNAFDHGIESAEIRSRSGKPEQGIIEICAYHQGSHTIIEVRDDGQGLNFEKIRSKAIELNLIRAEDTKKGDISHPTTELLECLFSPGFSTASKVNEISGRGMGLDIVHSQIQALNGSITVQSSLNQGTTFILKIPFSMTTDQLMLVQAEGAVYALLLQNIEKILLPSTITIKEFEGKKVFYWDTGSNERIVSIRKLSEFLYYGGSFQGQRTLQNKLVTDDIGTMINPVLLLRHNQELLGLEVDQIIGEQELVIRPLGQTITPPKYVYGCSNLANGTLILVIDSAVLLESYQMQAAIDVRVLPTDLASQTKALPMATSTRQNPSILIPQVSGEVKYKTPKVVLVVDDAISLRQTLCLTFQKFGYQVLQAQNGVEALEQLQQHPEVQVIISDLEMPRMNGFEFLSTVKQHPNLAAKPVVILTSRSSEKHRQLAQALGATAYITKPYLEHEFLATVESLSTSDV